MRLYVSELSRLMRHWLTVGMILIVMLIGGCNDLAVVVKPEDSGILPPSNPPTIAVEAKLPAEILAGQKPWLTNQSLPITKWYSQYLNGNCIGFSEFTIATSEKQGNNFLVLTKRDVLEFAATSTSPIQRREIVLESHELADGQLLRYTETSSTEGSDTESTAELQRDTLTLTKTVGDKTTINSLPWAAGTWGPLGTIAILQQQPMEPDEFREAKILVPPLDKIVKVELKSKKWELTTLPGGLVSELLLVETLFVTEKESALTKNWVNKAGEIVKSVSQGGFTMFLCTRDEVERIDGSIRAAQLIDTKIPVQATVEQLRAARVIFSIDSTNDDPFGLLSSKVNQKVKSLSALGATLTIDRAIPTDPIPEGALQDPPDESHRSKFNFDSAQLQKFLSELPVASENALSTASKLTEGVFQKIEKAPLSRHFSTVTQVIQQRKGDCKAHSALLTAALRERGIPARAASGLRIVKEKDGDQLFAIYHMWCEAWVGDRWMPLDPFAGSIGVGVDHIKFAESSLDEKKPISVMLNVLQNMKQLTIAVKQYSPRDR